MGFALGATEGNRQGTEKPDAMMFSCCFLAQCIHLLLAQRSQHLPGGVISELLLISISWGLISSSCQLWGQVI